MAVTETASCFGLDTANIATVAKQISDKDSLEGTSMYIPAIGAISAVEASFALRPEPVIHKGDGSILFSPAAMDPGIPYAFRFLSHYMLVVKSSEGAINVYYFDNPTEP